jgi:hypothetical protein
VGGYGPEASWSAGPGPDARHVVGCSGTGCHRAVLVGLCAATVKGELMLNIIYYIYITNEILGKYMIDKLNSTLDFFVA